MSKRETFLNPIQKNCKVCGAPFEIMPAEQQNLADKGLQFPSHCFPCRQRKHSIALIPCKDCGNTFEFSELDEAFYKSKGFEIPKRCPDCRKKRKVEREAAVNGR